MAFVTQDQIHDQKVRVTCPCQRIEPCYYGFRLMDSLFMARYLLSTYLLHQALGIQVMNKRDTVTTSITLRVWEADHQTIFKKIYRIIYSGNWDEEK